MTALRAVLGPGSFDPRIAFRALLLPFSGSLGHFSFSVKGRRCWTVGPAAGGGLGDAPAGRLSVPRRGCSSLSSDDLHHLSPSFQARLDVLALQGGLDPEDNTVLVSPSVSIRNPKIVPPKNEGFVRVSWTTTSPPIRICGFLGTGHQPLSYSRSTSFSSRGATLLDKMNWRSCIIDR